MNQIQRKYLIEKIKSLADFEIAELHKGYKKITFGEYIYNSLIENEHSVLLRSFINPLDIIIKNLKEKVKNDKSFGNFITFDYRNEDNDKITIKLSDIFQKDKYFDKLVSDNLKKKALLDKKAKEMRKECENAAFKINMASDKKLDILVEKIDTSIDLSDIQEKIKDLL